MAESLTAPRRALPEPTGRTRSTSTLTGTGTLARLILRRDRIRLAAWIAGFALYASYVGSALPEMAPTPQQLAATATLFDSPIGRMWVGPAFGMDAVTYERFFAGGYALYLHMMGALMGLLLVARHTRAEEQSGRAELIRANVVGRHAPLTAALIVAVIANLIAGIVATACLVGFGYATEGSLLIGATLGLTGLTFAAVAAVAVQLAESSRSAAGLAGAALGIAFAIRAVGDLRAVGGSTLSWLSPLGWGSQTAPYVHDRWWPLLLLVALSALCVVLTYVLASRRDFGAGTLPVRPGRAEAAPWLGTPLGLAWRLQRGGLLGWGTAIVLFGLVDGAFGQTMLDAADELPPPLLDVLGGAAGLADGYVAFLASFSGYLSAAYVVFAAQLLLVEENRGRAEIVLATPTSRAAWAGSHFAVIAVNAALIMALTGLLTGLAMAGTTGDWSVVADSTLAHLNLTAGVLVVLAVAAAIFGLLPRLLPIVGWALVAIILLVGVFAQLLDFPEWLLDFSPLRHPAQMPVEEFRLVPVLALMGAAAAGVLLGLVGLRQRQVSDRG